MIPREDEDVLGENIKSTLTHKAKIFSKTRCKEGFPSKREEPLQISENQEEYYSTVKGSRRLSITHRKEIREYSRGEG
ncbi:hypothetical protein CW711_01040 [Candidatus Bathyarchaeota archaeon]|nr:MAG: hypothetical protein CW711_01040 [Candidatus Bathyarchaeota archaeon]